MTQIQAVIFDLDNVLFDERDYTFAAYTNISRFLSKHYRLDEYVIFNKLLNDSEKKTSMYPRLFNDLLSEIGLEQDILSELMNIYKNVKCTLSLDSIATEILTNLKLKEVKLGLLTNGTIETQKNKVKLLGIEKYFDVIQYARELGKENEKPNPTAYLVILNKLDVNPKNAVCIGDNPYTDFWGAKKLGILTVRLLKGEYQKIKLTEEYEAAKTVKTLQEFYEFLEKEIDGNFK